MSGILALLAALPEITKLINAVMKSWKKAQDEQRLKDKFAEIHKGFVEEDGKKVNSVNNGDFEQRD